MLDLTLAYAEKAYFLLSSRDEKVDIPILKILSLKLLAAIRPAILMSVISILAIRVKNERVNESSFIPSKLFIQQTFASMTSD